MAAMTDIHGMPARPPLGSEELSQMLLARHFMTMKASPEPRNMMMMPSVAS